MTTQSNLELVLGTHNKGKAAELSAVLRNLGIDLLTLADFPQVRAVEETGATYEENAILKAQAYACATAHLTLADDSGLEVQALSGEPGVFSARHGGPGASDRERVELLLQQLKGIPAQERNARFVCVVALAGADGKVIRVERGICTGTIIDAARGSNGFGYDPIFVPSGYTSTFAELPSTTKDRISHRGQALAAMRQFLEQLIRFGSTS